MSWAGRLSLPWLWQSYYSLAPCVSTALPQAGLGAWPGLGCGNLIVHFHHVFPLHCHKLGWAFRLALYEANILFTCSLYLHYHAGLASMRFIYSRISHWTYNLFSLMTYHAGLAIVRLIYSTALYWTCTLFSLMDYHAGLATIRFIYNRILHWTCNLFSLMTYLAGLATIRLIYSTALH